MISLVVLARRLIEASPTQSAAIAATLITFGRPALQLASSSGISIRALAPGERYDDASPVLRKLELRLETWSRPPAGLFVVAERRMYLHSCTAMTVAHEFGHAIDCALGSGTYHSERSPFIQAAFRGATQWLTPYAATRIDEYFAEGLRALVEANTAESNWPRATRQRLRRVDPSLAWYLTTLAARDYILSPELEAAVPPYTWPASCISRKITKATATTK